MKTREQTRIMVVDDDPDVRDAIILALESAGYCTWEAANGQEALDQLAAGSLPDLILLDLMMPVMDGWQFRVRQVEVPGWNTIPVVIFSAGGNVEQKARNLAATGWLQKPVQLQTLLGEMERVFKLKS